MPDGCYEECLEVGAINQGLRLSPYSHIRDVYNAEGLAFGRQPTFLEVQMTLDELLRQIEAVPRRDPLTLRREDIPSAPGVYIWYSKATRCPVYIGKATGGNGLRHRI